MVKQAEFDKLKAQLEILNQTLNSKFQQGAELFGIKSEVIEDEPSSSAISENSTTSTSIKTRQKVDNKNEIALVYSASQEEELIKQANELLDRPNFLKFKNKAMEIYNKLEALWHAGTKAAVVVGSNKPRCVKCGIEPSKNFNRCNSCYELMRSLRKRLNVENYNTCGECARFTWMRSFDKCMTCYNKTYRATKSIKSAGKNNLTTRKSVLNDDEEIASKKRKIDESQNNTLRATLKKTEEKLTAQAHKLLSLPTKNESEMKRLSDELIRVWSEMAATVNRRGTKIECVKCGEIARNTGLFRCASCYARTYALRQKLKVENYENTELIDECCTKSNNNIENIAEQSNETSSSIAVSSNCQLCNIVMDSKTSCPINSKICRTCFVKERNRQIQIVCSDCKELHRHYSGGKCFECFEIQRELEALFETD